MMLSSTVPTLVQHHLLDDSHHRYAGRHVIFDVFGSPFSGNCTQIQAIMSDAVTATGATILYSHFHVFGKGCGFTGILVLSESHASVHTWPEVDLMTFDIYMCGLCDPAMAMKIILEKTLAKEHRVTALKRGILHTYQVE
jgi:S-adenosylmethionine decarboxylase